MYAALRSVMVVDGTRISAFVIDDDAHSDQFREYVRYFQPAKLYKIPTMIMHGLMIPRYNIIMVIDNFNLFRSKLTFKKAMKFDSEAGKIVEINDTYDRYIIQILRRAKDPGGKS